MTNRPRSPPADPIHLHVRNRIFAKIGRGGKYGRSITFFTGNNHERGLAGELARVLRESGVDVTPLSSQFPMTVKKKTHGVYGAFYREDVEMSTAPKRTVFDD